jgi:ABC-2 type transport system permease protein
MTWLVLARAELLLIGRNPLALCTAVLLPLALGLGVVWAAADAHHTAGADTATLQLLTLLACTSYTGATTMLAARRQELVLKRLRTTVLGDAGVLAGLLLPYAVLVAGQAAILVAATVAGGGQPPVRWWPIGLAVLAGTVLSLVLAFVTAAFTSAPELAQFTTAPVFLALFGGGMWLLRGGQADWATRAVPGVPVAELTLAAWQPGTVSVAHCVPALLAITAITVPAAALAFRVFRWEPRR